MVFKTLNNVTIKVVTKLFSLTIEVKVTIF